MGEWVIFDVIGFPHYKREKQGICFFYLRIFFSVVMLVFVKYLVISNCIMFNLFFEGSLFGIENKTKEKYF